jgi:hypothetical protein
MWAGLGWTKKPTCVIRHVGRFSGLEKPATFFFLKKFNNILKKLEERKHKACVFFK